MRAVIQHSGSDATPLLLVHAKTLPAALAKLHPSQRQWVETIAFRPEKQNFCLVPSEGQQLGCVLASVEEQLTLWSIAHLSELLPPGNYRIADELPAETLTQLAIGWELGCYRFSRYRKELKPFATLALPQQTDLTDVEHLTQAISWVRDQINTPAADMTPAVLVETCLEAVKPLGAKTHVTVGQALLKENYASIYTVGKASCVEPRLLDIRWGDSKHPKLTLIGKGVTFDSGGLNLKPASGMLLMKKDMAGAAVAVALGALVMAYKLPVSLRILIPAVENSVSSNAFHPHDIIKTRKGITVEVGNTDAEGRLILSDCLAEAATENPDLIIDCATLTGAARTALGTDMPAIFTPDDKLASELMHHSWKTSDPLWRLPLWQPYREMLKSRFADINSAPDSSYAGAITAALFLQEFVRPLTSWIHCDMMAWNLEARPGRPVGGEAMALRALFSLLRERYK